LPHAYGNQSAADNRTLAGTGHAIFAAASSAPSSFLLDFHRYPKRAGGSIFEDYAKCLKDH
jgi:hypothetical protein